MKLLLNEPTPSNFKIKFKVSSYELQTRMWIGQNTNLTTMVLIKSSWLLYWIFSQKTSPSHFMLPIVLMEIQLIFPGLCKSRWEKTRQLPAGSYEYIDVFHGGNRYIVETSLTSQFAIARPTPQYLSLLHSFPSIFIGRPETLKQLVRLMCAAAKESLKSKNLHLAPWRKNSYMMQRWFGSYKRTTNKITFKGLDDKHRVLAKPHMAGFDLGVGIPTLAYCSGEYVKKGSRVGNLALAFKGIEL